MYAVVNHLHFTRPTDEMKISVMSDGLPILSACEGFINFYLVKESENKAIVVILWQDAACAQNGAKTFGPNWFAPHVKPFLAEPENRSTGEVVIDYQAMY